MTYIPQFRPAADPGLIADIAKAINGEYRAIHCYEKLAGLAPNEEQRKQILEIRNDEIRHFHTFSQLYTSLTGRKPTPRITEPCASEYRAGLDASFKDEQETVDSYHEIARKTHDPHIRETFKDAAADEQNHAVWFLYYLTRR